MSPTNLSPPSTTADRGDDWTSRLPNTDHVRLFKSVDWAAVGLGPLHEWGPSLRFAANMVFADSRGACVYWGPKRIAFYNETFAQISQAAHPELMGSPFKVAFPELQDGIEPMFEKAWAEGVTVDVDHILLYVQRNGILEESYFVGQFIPLTGDNGAYGFYNTCYESTFRVMHDRRRTVLDRVTALPTTSVSTTFEHVVEALELDPKDIPMALIYSASPTTSGTYQLTLKGSVGVPAGHKIALESGDLHETKAGLFPLFRKAQNQETPLSVQTNDENLMGGGVSMLEGVKWTGHEEPSSQIVIAPLASTKTLFGFLVIGTNPRRPYDVPYQQFVHDLTQQLLAKLNSAISIEEARRREESLIRDLAESEARIRDMAIYSPVGMVAHGRDGEVRWGNQQYWDILGIKREETTTLESLIDLYHPDDLDKAHAMWDGLTSGVPYMSKELRLKRRFVAPDGSSEHAWVLVHGFCSREGGRNAKYLMACLTDISQQKWAESIESRNAAAAQDARRRQEEFIDLISHELRNPLGAIAIGAETIAKSLTSSKTPAGTAAVLDILYENVHIAETILACASHQKRIIDDVLLLSRLESLTLTIAAVQTNLKTLIESARRMFSGECKQNDIALDVTAHRSYADLQLDTVMCDPSRLMQIIINLLANGIKFVRPEAKREIAVTYGAALSAQDVQALNSAVRWCPSFDRSKEDPTIAPDWGDGQPLYVWFAIRDTGPGIDQREIDHLFQRFAQTSRLTHVHYGGSGLGLYISRELAEKHGGGIGIASQKGEGATFTFYIKTRRALEAALPARVLPHRQHQPKVDIVSRTANAERIASHNVASSNTKLQILLAEDNLVNQKFMARGLERNDYTVHVANHGLEAIDALKRSGYWNSSPDEEDHIIQPNGFTKLPQESSRIDLILMDWEMPILDGLTASKRIRQYEIDTGVPSHRRMPIIGITANARQEQIQKALDAGMDDVLPKPFLVSEMVEKVEEWRARIESGFGAGAEG